MSWLRALLSGRRIATGPGPGRPSPANTEAAPEHEGRLDPNTAALTEGAPPAGVSGRVSPEGEPPGGGTEPGHSETDTKHLPG